MFIGVLFLENITFFPDIIGYVFLIIGIKKAAAHCEFFGNTLKACYIGAALSLVKLVYKIAEWAKIELFGDFFGVIFAAVYTLFLVCFYMLLLLSIAKTAEYTGLTKIKRTSFANMMLVSLFLTASEALTLTITFMEEKIAMYSSQVAGTAMLLSILSTALVAILIFRCYMHICLEGDEQMEEERAKKFKNPFDFYDKNKKDNVSKKKKKK